MRKVAVQWDIRILADSPGRYARSLDEPNKYHHTTVESATVGLHSLGTNCTQPQTRYFYSVSLVGSISSGTPIGLPYSPIFICMSEKVVAAPFLRSSGIYFFCGDCRHAADVVTSSLHRNVNSICE